jgi:two-component system OmpR family response regulator
MGADAVTGRGGRPVRVLVVDDEPDLALLLTTVMTYEGWTSQIASTGAQAVAMATQFRPDVVVLDVMLPDMDGFAVLRALRAQRSDLCVLFLTARDSVEDRITGIAAGGDDYVTKPFSLEEVVARLRGLLRRAKLVRDSDDGQIEVGDLVLDELSREVRRGGQEIALTVTEFDLLRLLMLNERQVLTKSQILERVWHYDFGGDAHVVELFISYLRKKVDAGRAPMIHTVRGVGYVLKTAE